MISDETAKNAHAQLERIVPKFMSVKTKADTLKKEADKYSKEIKSIMSESEMTEFKIDNIEVKYIEQDKSTLDESKVLELLKKNLNAEQLAKVIVVTESVDMKQLEDLIYNGALDKNVLIEMNKCKIEKKVPMLRAKIKE